MARRGRPKSAQAASAVVIHVKMRLYPGEDDDLISFIAKIPRGLAAASVKRAILDGAGQSGDGVEDNRLLDAFTALVDSDSDE